jgi:tetratricopeptide (TPR) repeat protein
LCCPCGLVRLVVRAANDPATASKVKDIWAAHYAWNGLDAAEAGRTAEAEADFAAALAMNPAEAWRTKRFRIWGRLTVLFDKDELDAADRFSDAVIADDPQMLRNVIDTYIFYGSDRYSMSAHDEQAKRLAAEKEGRLLHHAVTLALVHDTAMPLLWNTLERLKNASHLAKAQGSEPLDEAGYIIRGFVHEDKGENKLDKGEMKLAIAAYSTAIEMTPRAFTYNTRGNVNYFDGEYDLAIEDYSRAIGLSPNDAVLYGNRAGAYSQKNENRLATADYSKAIELDAKNRTAYSGRALAYRASGQFDLAIADYGKAIELDPRNRAAYSDRALAYRANGQFDLAIADATRAIELDANSASAYDDRGDAFADNDQYDLAIADYGKAIELDPKFVGAYLDRGGLRLAKGESNLALADATKAFETDPTGVFGAWALLVRGNMHFILGDFAGASSDLVQSLKLNDSVYAMLSLYLARSRTGEARALDELRSNVARLKTKKWPGPVVELYLGTRSPTDTLGAASNRFERCEAQYYVGEWHVLNGHAADAKAMLASALETCARANRLHVYAEGELKRLRP